MDRHYKRMKTTATKKILVRLPNWLGDLVMSTGFLSMLKHLEPESSVDVIIKENLQDFIPLLTGINRAITFSKKRYPFFWGAVKFGRLCAVQEHYDLFFTLPDSFSSALSAFFSKSKNRVGYAAESRSILLTHVYKKPSGMHRAEEYVNLLQFYYKSTNLPCTVHLKNPQKDETCSGFDVLSIKRSVLFNINSAAVSRRIPSDKSAALGRKLIDTFGCTLIFPGMATDSALIKMVIEQIGRQTHCIDLTGMTTLGSLVRICDIVSLIVSSDSGIAHVANALGKPVIVLFGAGNEHNTAPYNKEKLSIVRAPGIPCAPCVSNNCSYGHVNCMNHLDEADIILHVRTLTGWHE